MKSVSMSSWPQLVTLILCMGCCHALLVFPEKSSLEVGLDTTTTEQKSLGSHELSLKGQVMVLEKQLTALMTRRREDYQLLENNLKKFLLETARRFSDIDIRTELNNLKEEVHNMRNLEKQNVAKEQPTLQWLSQSIDELRKEVAEVQQVSSETSRSWGQHGFFSKEELHHVKAEMNSLTLEVESIRSRQERNEELINEVQTETQESMEELRSLWRNSLLNKNAQSATMDMIDPEVDHQQRVLRQQMHKLKRIQHQMKHELHQLQNHHLEQRLTSVEQEQRRLLTSSMNLNHEVANLDKMHSSVLELLEDVGEVEAKIDTVMPDVRHEISKLEFNMARLSSEQGLVREEGLNRAQNIQRISARVAALQAMRESKPRNTKKERFEGNSSSGAITGTLKGQEDRPSDERSLSPIQSRTLQVVQKLERMEGEFENIVSELPNDCSQLNNDMERTNGLFLIAPGGQHPPVIVRCHNQWTLVQKRFDGSIDFNRSWEEYSMGFGNAGQEFWVGNERLHHLTQDNCTQLRVEMRDIYDNFWYAEYGFFKVESRGSGYRIIISDYRGNATDALEYQNHMEFSAADVDRDISNTHCAANYEGGWWFSHCQHANLNGRYSLGLTWFDSLRNEWIAVKSSQMWVGKDLACLQNKGL